MAKKNKPIDWRVLVAVILALTVIEVAALIQGINGALFSIIVFALGAIGGIAIPFKTK